jgi:hypothetical protein
MSQTISLSIVLDFSLTLHVLTYIHDFVWLCVLLKYLNYDNISVNIVSGALHKWPNWRAATAFAYCC